jgi:hypothetical protein
MPRVAANAAAKEILVKTRQTHARTTLRNVRYLRGLGLVAWALGVTLGLAPARGLTLVATNAGLLDTSHPQVATLGGDTAHLLRVVTPGDRLTTALDLDVLLADGAPLTMTWRRDAGDAATIELAASLVIDSTPCHLAVQVRPVYDAVVALGAIGEVSTNSLVVVQQPALAVLRFAAGIGPLSDLALGAVDSTITYGPVDPWLIDVSGMAAGERFELSSARDHRATLMMTTMWTLPITRHCTRASMRLTWEQTARPISISTAISASICAISRSSRPH